MAKKNRTKTLILGIVIVTTLVFGVNFVAFSGGPEPPGGDEKITGKAKRVILTAVQISINGWPVVVQVIVGECNDAQFQLGPYVEENGPITSNNIGDIVESSLLYQVLPDAGPAGCYSEDGGEDLIITKVTEFFNSGTAVSAVVNLQMIQ